MITRDSIFVARPREKVYAVACDLRRQHEYIPGYLPAKLAETAEGLVVERSAEVQGRQMNWKSRVWFDDNRAIRFEQVEGRLRGMKIEWAFESAEGGTRVTITHHLPRLVPLIGWAITLLAVKPAVDRLTGNVLKGLKARVEKETDPR